MSISLFNLTGKVALVTGSTHGLGMSIAMGLGKAGATIVVNGNSAQQRITEALEIYKSQGIHAVGYRFDVTDESQVIKSITQIESEVGTVDILVNNAGIIKRTLLEDMPVEDFKQVLEVDLVSPFIVSKHVVKKMIAQKSGKIINICSMMSEVGRDSVGAYSAAKGGLKMLTKSMATEWAKYNIQVNGIGPGYFATSQTAPLRTVGHPFNDFILSRTPAGKWGNPDDLAGAAIFLSSKASDFVNGHILYVDGGILATLGKPIDAS
ncbi:gluconate 5-dehydrogenase [Arenibacter sp. GZD96]|uniref:gluconate 5-dehydrogenase n=1 Tax=Aurantibrevibacter litoralis TaxID=3106030 RepID=UPI002AFE8DA5|nr:gluconate 5-dehydrogenase [Arenibacter sp. GZD-96]MEA1786977.1 gluconate 5-dehydrogenase [Arenibacter sp. GZD-96]